MTLCPTLSGCNSCWYRLEVSRALSVRRSDVAYIRPQVSAGRADSPLELLEVGLYVWRWCRRSVEGSLPVAGFWWLFRPGDIFLCSFMSLCLCGRRAVSTIRPVRTSVILGQTKKVVFLTFAGYIKRGKSSYQCLSCCKGTDTLQHVLNYESLFEKLRVDGGDVIPKLFLLPLHHYCDYGSSLLS